MNNVKESRYRINKKPLDGFIPKIPIIVFQSKGQR
jgi:hypothetical protein